MITVSHDRYFLDNVVDRIFELDGNGGIRQFEGGYTDYVEAKKRRFGEESKAITGKSEIKAAEKSTEEETQEKKTGKNWKDGQRQKVKFSFKEQRDLLSLLIPKQRILSCKWISEETTSMV